MQPYLERRGLSIPTVVFALVIPATVWWVCLATDSLVFAWACAGITAAAVWWLTLNRALERVEVQAEALRVGKATLDSQWMGRVESLLGDAWETTVRQTDPKRSWLSIRSFHAGGVQIENTDPADPIDWWLVSSRNPVALASAIDKTGR